MSIFQEGPCTENIPSWSFDSKKGVCTGFTYGGNNSEYVFLMAYKVVETDICKKMKIIHCLD